MAINYIFCHLLILHLCMCFKSVICYPEQGKWVFEINNNNEMEQSVVITKSLFNGSKIFVKLFCQNSHPESILNITWYLRKAFCWKEYYESDPVNLSVDKIFNTLNQEGLKIANLSSVHISDFKTVACDEKVCFLSSNKSGDGMTTSEFEAKTQQEEARAIAENEKKMGLGSKSSPFDYEENKRKKRELDVNSLMISGSDSVKLPTLPRTSLLSRGGAAISVPLFTVPADGIYQFFLGIKIIDTQKFNVSYKATIHIEISSSYGYLSAADYPLLIFYGTLCVIYVIYGIGWLIVSFMRWREMLRVQYWIGAVILLGMLEKAVFTAEYESVNNRGVSIPGFIVFAELVSCAKRTLSRMLVIIVSFGFGIVKPRLGIVLHRVVGVGILYFIIASIEGCMRALKSKLPDEEYHRRLLFAIIPLALLESAICWWVFSALVSTTRTLRLRRNVIKLNLFRHFTNTLIFAVGTSVVFMLWTIKYQNYDSCMSDWKQLWVNDAFWHVLFAIILLVIMILWRPTNNNQRFAFSPLLDEGSEGDEDEQEKLMINISDSTKLRNQRSSNSSSPRNSHSVEDDLKWMEENIPSMTDTGFPVLDSDEELVTTKFEISKMQ